MTVSEPVKGKMRHLVPTWATLRSIGNSRPVQASAVFPLIGYFLLLSDDVREFFSGGIVNTGTQPLGVSQHLWSMKLYFVYFGLLHLGIGSALYQWMCPRQIKKHADWEDYVRIDGSVMAVGYVENVRQMLVHTYNREVFRTVDIMNQRDPSELTFTILNHFYSCLSHEKLLVRAVVAYLFCVGFLILAIPSLMTLVRVLETLLAL